VRSCWSLSPSTSLSKTDFQNCKGSLTVRGARVFASFLMKMLCGGICEDEFLMWVSSLRRIIETTRVVAPVKMKPMMTPWACHSWVEWRKFFGHCSWRDHCLDIRHREK
jgi:hypothetical protein